VSGAAGWASKGFHLGQRRSKGDNDRLCLVLSSGPLKGLVRQVRNAEFRAKGEEVKEGPALEDIRLSIVVTVYTETFSISQTLETLLGRDRGYILEILLLISPKASEESFRICGEWAARDPRIHVLVQKNNPGIGWAYREGMEAASGNFIALMAADLETEPAAVDRMVDKILETGCDEVVANRWLSGGGFTNYDPLKYVLNWAFQKTFRVLFRTRIGDLTFGFKILSKEVCQAIDWRGTLHEICIETTVKPIKAGFYVEQVPSVWVGRKEGRSVNTFLRNFRYVKCALAALFASAQTG
jgi:glycosyltransferase involved in cell wall biosynthesis